MIDPDTDAVVDTLKADRGSLTALNPVTNKLYVSASTGTDPTVIDLATKQSTVIRAGTEGNALSVNVKTNKIYFVGYEDNFLTVVDGATNEPTRVEVPGFHQWDSAFNETNGLLSLPTPNNDAVTVIDTKTNVVSTADRNGQDLHTASDYGSSGHIDGASNRAIYGQGGLWPQRVTINTDERIARQTRRENVGITAGRTRSGCGRTEGPYEDQQDVVNTHANSVSVIDGRTNTMRPRARRQGPLGRGGHPVRTDHLCRQSSERQGHRDRWRLRLRRWRRYG